MKKINSNKGFTLLEVLVATTIFSIAVLSMYTVYISMQHTTVNQSNLVDVEQNLRVTFDMLNRDIKMTSALIPAGTTGVATGSDATTLNLTTASSLYTYARIATDIEIPAGAATTTAFSFSVSSPTSVDQFSAGDNLRIIRPQNGEQPYDIDLRVDGVDRAAQIIDIEDFNNTDAVQYKAGDIIARVGAGGPPDPCSVVWNLNGTDLQRNRDNSATADTMASDISTLRFDYLLDDGTETTTPTNAQLNDIQAIRVTITADATRQLDGRTRNKTLSSVTYIRNNTLNL